MYVRLAGFDLFVNNNNNNMMVILSLHVDLLLLP